MAQTAPRRRDVDQSKSTTCSRRSPARARPASSSPAAKTGLDKPELTITIKFDEGKRARRSRSRSAAPTASPRARRAGAAKVDIAAIDNIVKALEDAEIALAADRRIVQRLRALVPTTR